MSTATASQPHPADTSEHLIPRIGAEMARLTGQRRPRYRQLWHYYRQASATDRLTSNAMPGPEGGLPSRLNQAGGRAATSTNTPERVLENDIAWRIHGMVDFMVSRPPAIQSLVADPERADDVERFIRRIIDDNGGQAFYQTLALIGHVYGFADAVLRLDADPDRPILFDLVDAPTALPIVDPDDYTALNAYGIYTNADQPHHQSQGWLDRLRDRVTSGSSTSERSRAGRVEVLTEDSILVLEPGRQDRLRVVDRTPNPLGVLPVVHIQNLPQPFAYEGLSEVEPLIALQDELNTRLSDRAHRVTLQSFKMYLAKGLDGFGDRPVAPGQMWTTDNPEASIESFGGDATSPSEEAHIRETREALDKASAISPLVTGQVRDRLGNLTSENALRIVTMGLVARTEKKRFAYGQGIQRLIGLALHAADLLGVFPNTPDDRRLHIDWPDPMPLGESERLRNAQLKLELGVPRRRVLAELGYTAADLATDTDTDEISSPASPHAEETTP